MNTGIKTIDALIQRFGIKTVETHDVFQQVMSWTGNDPRLGSYKLPYCFYQLIINLPSSKAVTLHHYYLPHRKARLASFVVNEEGKVIEQVFYLRDAKHIQACKKLQQAVQHAHMAVKLKMA